MPMPKAGFQVSLVFTGSNQFMTLFVSCCHITGIFFIESRHARDVLRQHLHAERAKKKNIFLILEKIKKMFFLAAFVGSLGS
jgi:hypothetical protein